MVITRVRRHGRDAYPKGILIIPDSEYTVLRALVQAPAVGDYELASNLHKLTREASALLPVQFGLVKGHSYHWWNERADALASRGGRGNTSPAIRWVAEET